jgi:hypothetical protein
MEARAPFCRATADMIFKILARLNFSYRPMAVSVIENVKSVQNFYFSPKAIEKSSTNSSFIGKYLCVT